MIAFACSFYYEDALNKYTQLPSMYKVPSFLDGDLCVGAWPHPITHHCQNSAYKWQQVTKEQHTKINKTWVKENKMHRVANLIQGTVMKQNKILSSSGHNMAKIHKSMLGLTENQTYSCWYPLCKCRTNVTASVCPKDQRHQANPSILIDASVNVQIV